MIHNPMYAQADTRGYVPADHANDLLNAQFVHTNGTVYTIRKFTFDAERDLWEIEYGPVDFNQRGLSFSRTPENFFGKNEDGERRFRRINPVSLGTCKRVHDGRGPG